MLKIEEIVPADCEVNVGSVDFDFTKEWINHYVKQDSYTNLHSTSPWSAVKHKPENIMNPKPPLLIILPNKLRKENVFLAKTKSATQISTNNFLHYRPK